MAIFLHTAAYTHRPAEIFQGKKCSDVNDPHVKICSEAGRSKRFKDYPKDPKNLSVLTFNFQLFDVEIKYGLLQLCEGLAFLHDSVKLLHRNISPESIILNHQGAWKIFGFDFCLQNTQPNGVNPNWDFPLNDAMASDALRY